MARSVRPEIYTADRELGRFIRYQHSEARKLGYPTMATFARDIARGTIGPAPLTEEDPIMDAVGEFFHGLSEIERRVLAEKYLAMGTLYERARRVGVSVRALGNRLDRVLERLSGFLLARGF